MCSLCLKTPYCTVLTLLVMMWDDWHASWRSVRLLLSFCGSVGRRTICLRTTVDQGWLKPWISEEQGASFSWCCSVHCVPSTGTCILKSTEEGEIGHLERESSSLLSFCCQILPAWLPLRTLAYLTASSLLSGTQKHCIRTLELEAHLANGLFSTDKIRNRVCVCEFSVEEYLFSLTSHLKRTR